MALMAYQVTFCVEIVMCDKSCMNLQENGGSERPVRAAGVGLVICDGGPSGALLEEMPSKEQVRSDTFVCV